MALPISVGDAILLSQIAYNLGIAFTSGRKSAPAEFSEIQDLLYTLGGALKLLARGLPDDAVLERGEISSLSTEIDEENALLSQTIINCRGLLSHLEALVEKYTELDIKSSRENQTRRWTEDIRKNWKKVLWTKEGGDIAKLKVTLAAHISGLNLAIGVINKRHGSIIQDQVETMHSKLDDIYAWFQQNLEGRRPPAFSGSPRHREPATDDGIRLIFSVSIHLLPGPQYLRLHCPHASFQPGWLDPTNPFQSASSIFQCHCNRASGQRNHDDELHVTLKPSSLLVRVAQSSGRKWHMFAAAKILPNRSNYIYISNVEPSRIAEFEEQASRLAIYQAKGYLDRGHSSGLVSIQPYMTGGGVISVLNTKSEIHPETDADEDCRITFRANNRHFVVTANSIYSVLQYRSMSDSIVRAVPESAHSSSFMIDQPQAELVFQRGHGHPTFLDEIDNQYYIGFLYDTHIAYGVNQRIVRLSDVLCVSEQKQTNRPALVQQIVCDSVEVEFNESKDASECLKNIQTMQQELFNIYLQYPRCGENIVFQRFFGDIIIHDHYIPSTHMTVVFNPLDGQYRVILQSECHSVAACMELSPQILESLIKDPCAGVREYPAYLVLVGKEEIDVVKQNIRLDEFVPHGRDDDLHPLLQGIEAAGSGQVSKNA